MPKIYIRMASVIHLIYQVSIEEEVPGLLSVEQVQFVGPTKRKNTGRPKKCRTYIGNETYYRDAVEKPYAILNT